ncbi:helix-turn-helix domain-containing protein [Roseovarius faecimaris]|uniref:Helix-turn-helix domain-containing protein n=1 Tax=Roseovarius faecimaris TaxID=2494550 RepID=A0A6I6ISJ9_9RHOB|nr:helix-turn-helix domain-containing protein [Roseovarius faecimaris]QGX99114.1 helix-turn-helix domain-containing protein [Roseovarius faecimaris]
MDKTAVIHNMAKSLLSVGSEIRQLRKARQMTLKSLSEASGVSLSHLSAIERGTAQPSMDVLNSVATALSVTPDWFFARRSGDGPIEQACVVRAQNRRNLNSLYQQSVRELGYTDALLSSSIGGDFYMGMTVYEPYSDQYEDTLLKHIGEVHAFMIEGELQVQIADEVITLHEGDSYSCDAEIPHRAINLSDKPARLIWAISPVVIPKDVLDSDDDTSATEKDEK